MATVTGMSGLPDTLYGGPVETVNPTLPDKVYGGPVETNSYLDQPKMNTVNEYDTNKSAQELSKAQGVAFEQISQSPQGDGFNYNKASQEPTTKSVSSYMDDAKSTVAGQLQTLLGSDNPYIKQAERDAVETAAGSGLLNSTIAMGKGRDAAYEQGFNIASQDAENYNIFQGRNQEADIQSNLAAQGYSAEERLQSEQARQGIAQTGLEAAIDTEENKQLHSYDQADTTLEGNIDAQRAAQLQKYEQANTLMEGQIQSQLDQAGYESAMELQEAAMAGNEDAIKLQGEIQDSRDRLLFQQSYTQSERDFQTNVALTKLGIEAEEAALYTEILGGLTQTGLQSVNALLNNVDITDVGGAIEVIKGFLGSSQLGSGTFDTSMNLTGLPSANIKPATGKTTAPTAAPTTTTPGQSDDPLWEEIISSHWDKHVSDFGVGWNTGATNNAEREAQMNKMLDQYNARKDNYYG